MADVHQVLIYSQSLLFVLQLESCNQFLLFLRIWNLKGLEEFPYVGFVNQSVPSFEGVEVRKVDFEKPLRLFQSHLGILELGFLGESFDEEFVELQEPKDLLAILNRVFSQESFADQTLRPLHFEQLVGGAGVALEGSSEYVVEFSQTVQQIQVDCQHFASRNFEVIAERVVSEFPVGRVDWSIIELNPPLDPLHVAESIELVPVQPLNLFIGKPYFSHEALESVEILVAELLVNQSRGNGFDEVLILHELRHYSTESSPNPVLQRESHHFAPKEVS